jgi:hypothetical protein
MQTGYKIIHIPELIQKLTKIKTEHRGRIKARASFLAVTRCYQRSHKREIY